MIRSLSYALLLIIAVPVSAAAQCWECEVQYYQGNDCWMRGCWGTDLEGAWDECSQQGDCDDEECEAGGEICEPEVYSMLMDGRAPSRSFLWANMSDLEDHPSLVAVREEDGFFFRTECSGIMVRAWYTPEQLRSKRIESSVLRFSEASLPKTMVPK